MRAPINCSISSSYSQYLCVLAESVLVNLLIFPTALFYILFGVCSYEIVRTPAINNPHEEEKVLYLSILLYSERGEDTRRHSLIQSIDPSGSWGSIAFVTLIVERKKNHPYEAYF